MDPVRLEEGEDSEDGLAGKAGGSNMAGFSGHMAVTLAATSERHTGSHGVAGQVPGEHPHGRGPLGRGLRHQLAGLLLLRPSEQHDEACSVWRLSGGAQLGGRWQCRLPGAAEREESREELIKQLLRGWNSTAESLAIYFDKTRFYSLLYNVWEKY